MKVFIVTKEDQSKYEYCPVIVAVCATKEKALSVINKQLRAYCKTYDFEEYEVEE